LTFRALRQMRHENWSLQRKQSSLQLSINDELPLKDEPRRNDKIHIIYGFM